MSDSKYNETDRRFPTAKQLVGDRRDEYRLATGSADPRVQLHILREIEKFLLTLPDQPEETSTDRFEMLVSLLKELRPTDAVEGALCSQMIAVHEVAMDCLRRAMLPGQPFEGRELNLRNAQRLLATYTRLVEALDKHRGKGQQQVTVKYVHVAPGGQAVVGNVQTSARLPSGAAVEPPALTDQTEGPFVVEAPLAPIAAPAITRVRG